MNKLIKLFLIFFAGCGTLSAQSLHIAKDNVACLYGLKNDSGRWVVKPIYTQLDEFHAGTAVVSKGTRYGLIDEKGNIIVPVEYEDFQPSYSWYSSTYFSTITGMRYIKAKRNGKYGILSKSGSVMIPFEYDRLDPQEQHPGSSYYNYGSGDVSPVLTGAIAMRGGLYGLVDSTGKTIIPFEYDMLTPQSGSNIYLTMRNKRYGLRSKEKELFPPRYAWIEQTSWGDYYTASDTMRNQIYASITPFIGKRIGVIDSKGDTIIPFLFDQITMPHYPSAGYTSACSVYLPERMRDGPPLIRVMKNQLEGFYSFKGELLLEPKYELSSSRAPAFPPEPRAGDFFAYEENGKWRLVAIGKQPQKTETYDALTSISTTKYIQSRYVTTSLWRARTGKKIALLDHRGKTIIPAEYDSIYFLRNEPVLLAIQKNSYFVFDTAGKKIAPQKFETVAPPHFGELQFLAYKDSIYCIRDGQLHTFRLIRKITPTVYAMTMDSPNNPVFFERSGKYWKQLAYGYGSEKRTNWSITTSTGPLLCDLSYQLLLSSNAFAGFGYYGYTDRSFAMTKTGKIGLIDPAGKLVLDTVYEAIGEAPFHGMHWVKPWQPYDSTVASHCYGGWALADSTGHLIIAPRVLAPPPSYMTGKFYLRTKSGLGIFDEAQLRYIIQPLYSRIAQFSDCGYLLRTSGHHFAAADTNGNLLTDTSWTNILHIGIPPHGFVYKRSYGWVSYPQIPTLTVDVNPSANKEESPPRLTTAGTAWLLIKNDSIIVFCNSKIYRNRADVFDLFGLYTAEAADDAEQISLGMERDFEGTEVEEQFTTDCPSLRVAAKNNLPKPVRDTLLLRIMTHADTLQDQSMFDDYNENCQCIGASDSYGNSPYTDDDFGKQEPHMEGYDVSFYKDGLISFLYTSSTYYWSDHRFANYRISNGKWDSLSLSNLFAPGYEPVLQSELTKSIQAADSLELDCSDQNTFLSQTENRFSLSEKGLILYIDYYKEGEKTAGLLIPWKRLRPLLVKDGPVTALAKNAR